MRRVVFSTIAFLWIACLPSCKEDEYTYPEVLTEFIDIQTDESGTATRLVTDKGESYRIQSRDGLSGLSADSLYRTLSVYALSDAADGESTAQLYSCSLVLSPVPLPAKSFRNGIKTDPADIQSMWRSGGYLNMVLLVQVKEESHLYHFVNEGITSENGVQTLHLRLYHDSNNDYAAFTHKAYLSVPLWYYANVLTAGDKVRFYLNTDKEGETYREFDY